jgi:hypothetical protein
VQAVCDFGDVEQPIRPWFEGWRCDPREGDYFDGMKLAEKFRQLFRRQRLGFAKSGFERTTHPSIPNKKTQSLKLQRGCVGVTLTRFSADWCAARGLFSYFIVSPAWQSIKPPGKENAQPGK